MSEMDKLFYDMVDKRLASTSSSWIQTAVRQKHPKLTLDLAHSILLAYGNLDKVIIHRQRLN